MWWEVGQVLQKDPLVICSVSTRIPSSQEFNNCHFKFRKPFPPKSGMEDSRTEWSHPAVILLLKTNTWMSELFLSPAQISPSCCVVLCVTLRSSQNWRRRRETQQTQHPVTLPGVLGKGLAAQETHTTPKGTPPTAVKSSI